MKAILTLLLVLNCIIMKAQDLTTHQWENRVLLVISDNKNTEAYQTQISIFKDKTKALADRKLVVYSVLPTKYKLNNDPWLASSSLFKKYRSKNKTFKVVLIGLDGLIKLNENAVILAEKLFSIIDVMPMRQSEIKRKGN